MKMIQLSRKIERFTQRFAPEINGHHNLFLEWFGINLVVGNAIGNQIGADDPKAQVAMAAFLHLGGLIAFKIIPPSLISFGKRACLEASWCGKEPIKGSMVDTPTPDDIAAHHYRLLVTDFAFMLAPEIALTVAMGLSKQTALLNTINYFISWGPAPFMRAGLGLIVGRITQSLFLQDIQSNLTNSWFMYPAMLFTIAALYSPTAIENYLPNLLSVIKGLPIELNPTPLLNTRWTSVIEVACAIMAMCFMRMQKLPAYNMNVTADYLQPNEDPQAQEKAPLVLPQQQSPQYPAYKKAHFQMLVALASYTVITTLFNLLYSFLRVHNSETWDATRTVIKGPLAPVALFGMVCFGMIAGRVTGRYYPEIIGPGSRGSLPEVSDDKFEERSQRQRLPVLSAPENPTSSSAALSKNRSWSGFPFAPDENTRSAPTKSASLKKFGV